MSSGSLVQTRLRVVLVTRATWASTTSGFERPGRWTPAINSPIWRADRSSTWTTLQGCFSSRASAALRGPPRQDCASEPAGIRIGKPSACARCRSTNRRIGRRSSACSAPASSTRPGPFTGIRSADFARRFFMWSLSARQTRSRESLARFFFGRPNFRARCTALAHPLGQHLVECLARASFLDEVHDVAAKAGSPPAFDRRAGFAEGDVRKTDGDLLGHTNDIPLPARRRQTSPVWASARASIHSAAVHASKIETAFK
jgi:hypothetical protein